MLSYPDQIIVVAVAEPDPLKRKEFAQLHQLSTNNCYESWETLFKEPKLADVAINITQDQNHAQTELEAMKKGFQVLLENPIVTNSLDFFVVK